jgi:hypothetical protein
MLPGGGGAPAAPGPPPGRAAFLTRQLRWDKAAVVRLRAGSDGVLAAFTRPARFEVLAVRPSRLTGPAELDTTVSAGQLLHAVDEETGTLTVPPPVTGAPWTGVLPPRGDWRRVAELPGGQVRDAAAATVAEFRDRSERLEPALRTRAALDALAEDVWDRDYPGTALPLRAVHAAHALGFLRGPGPVAVLAGGPWLRLRTGHGSIVVRRADRPRLSLTPVRSAHRHGPAGG